jgi:hypothetical protein
MIQALILIQGTTVKKEALTISLSNAKQLVIGSAPAFGTILHVAANSPADLGKALLAFAKIAGVTGVLTLGLQNQ